jgi:hypothetical protein
MPERNDQPTLDPGAERQLASALFNRVWTLTELETRSEAEDADCAQRPGDAPSWHLRMTPTARTGKPTRRHPDAWAHRAPGRPGAVHLLGCGQPTLGLAPR